MLCSVARCFQQLSHDVQRCYMLPIVITCCAVLLDVTKCYYIWASVVACNLVLLHAWQCC